jgi:hypothetical protein
MKNIFLLYILLTLFSCVNKKEECKYVPNLGSIDSSMFISYSINNINYRFFQFYQSDFQGDYSNTYLKTNGLSIFSTYYPFFFGDINLNKSQVVLTFYDTTLYADGGIFHQRTLRKRLNTNYKFTIPKKASPDAVVITDTLFLRGVSFSINDNEYSTENLIKHYNFNADSLSKYLWRDSYFRINKIENACGWDKFIEGEFSTTVNKVDDNSLVKIEKGRFRLLINN